MNSFEIKTKVLMYWRYARAYAYISTETGRFYADVLVSNGKNIIEIEVKTSYSDLKNDFKKRKHKFYRTEYSIGVPNKFYFAVPENLVEKTKELTKNTPYGIIKVLEGNFTKDKCEIIQSAKFLHKNFSNSVLNEIIKRMSSEICILRYTNNKSSNTRRNNMPLQIDYRPSSFDEFYGNEELIENIQANLKRDDVNHIMLFTGLSGGGKTTLARIVASELGAYNHELSEQQNVDYYEYNSADARGIDTFRQIRKQIRLSPKKGKYSVYVLEECHQITGDSMEMLLKMTEPLPDHVFFILTTTNPEKLKITLKRRCTVYEVQPCDDDQLKELIESIAESESKKIPKDVLNQIVSDSIGSPGVAMSILDKIIHIPKKSMLKMAKQEAAKQNQIIDLCRKLIQRPKWKQILPILNDLKKENPESIRRSILAYFTSLLLKKDDANAYIMLDCFSDNTYDDGFSGIVRMCYEALQND